jgi:thiosulfate dehydrogenase [quinone] large subunit
MPFDSPEADRSLAYGLLRLVIGVNILLHGFVRLLTGLGAFVDSMRPGLEKSPLPDVLELPVLYAVPFVELLLGLLLVPGLLTRHALVGGLLLMAVLTTGSAFQAGWAAAQAQLFYAMVFAGLLFLRQPYNTLSVDAALARRQAGRR